MKSWAQRVKSKMIELGMTQEELARKMGITRSSITHYFAGRRTPPLVQFQKLASILKTDPAWLQYGTTKSTALKNKSDKSSLLNPIPILSWEQASEVSNVANLDPKEIKEWLNFYTNKSSLYALRVKTDSMAAQNGLQSFHEGDIIIVDPTLEVCNNNFVIALSPQAKEVTFRQYVIEGGSHYLKPLNPHYPLAHVGDETIIRGIVVNRVNDF